MQRREDLLSCLSWQRARRHSALGNGLPTSSSKLPGRPGLTLLLDRRGAETLRMHMAPSNIMRITNAKLRLSPESSVSVVPMIGRLLLTFHASIKAGEEFKDIALLRMTWRFLLLKSRSSLPPWNSDGEVGEDRDRPTKLVCLTFGSYP